MNDVKEYKENTRYDLNQRLLYNKSACLICTEDNADTCIGCYFCLEEIVCHHGRRYCVQDDISLIYKVVKRDLFTK